LCFAQFVTRRRRIAHLRVLGEEAPALAGLQRIEGGWTFDEVPQFAHVLVEEDEHRDGAKLPLEEVLAHQVVVLVAPKEVQTQFARLICQLRQDGQAGRDVAGRILCQDQDIEGLRQVAEEVEVRWVDYGRLLVLQQTLAMLCHAGDKLLVGHALFQALACHCHAASTFLAIRYFAKYSNCAPRLA